MQTFVTDTNVVGESEAVLFSFFQSGPVDAAVTIRNSGANTMNYVFEEFNGTAWVALGALGTVYQDTLTAGEVVILIIDSAYPQVRMQGDASGGAQLEFAVSRYYARPSGGAIPILNL